MTSKTASAGRRRRKTNPRTSKSHRTNKRTTATNGATKKAPADAPTEVTTTDEFDLKNLVLDQKFVESAGVKKLLTTVPVKKPGKQDYCRCASAPGLPRQCCVARAS